MYIYRGKLNWFSYAENEAITIIVPQTFQLGDPVYEVHQWTQDSQGQRKSIHFSAGTVDSADEERIGFFYDKYYRFDATLINGIHSLSVVMRNPSGDTSPAMTLNLVYDNDITESSIPRVYVGKMDWYDYAVDETFVVIAPDPMNRGQPLCAFWQWTIDGGGNPKVNANVVDSVRTTTRATDGEQEVTFSSGYYRFTGFVDEYHRRMNVTMRNPQGDTQGPFPLDFRNLLSSRHEDDTEDFCTEMPSDDDIPFDGSDDENDSATGTDDEDEESSDIDVDHGENDEDDGGESLSDKRIQFRAMMQKSKQWRKRKGKPLRLTVSFIGGSSAQRNMVKRHAVEWEQDTGIRFRFKKKYGTIRVAFKKGRKCSKVGTDALRVKKKHPTMNLGLVNQRTILHEFGHALGLGHEHTSPSANIPWDKPKVYRYYHENLGWNKRKVDHNIFARYAKSTTNYTQFDPDSIMLYNIPADLLKPNSNFKAIKKQSTLSYQDKKFMAERYPA